MIRRGLIWALGALLLLGWGMFVSVLVGLAYQALLDAGWGVPHAAAVVGLSATLAIGFVGGVMVEIIDRAESVR